MALACACLTLRQRIASAISAADSSPAIGSSRAMNSAASRGPYWNSAARLSLRNNHWPGKKLSDDSVAINMPTLATAAHLPSTMAKRGAGLVSSGSRLPRSRSPAVVSSAAVRAP